MGVLFNRLRGVITIRTVLEGLGLIFLLWLAYFLLNWFGVWSQTEDIKAVIQEAGIWGALVFSLSYLLTIVIAPLPGFPIYVAGIGIYGLLKSLILCYLLLMLGAGINFFIAKRFGRPLMRRLIGKSGEVRVEKHTKEFGTEVLVLTRLFDGFVFEYVSYAAGLTPISFRKYMLITIWGTIPYHVLLYAFGLAIPELGKMFLVLSGVNYVLMMVPLVYFFVKHRFFQRTIKD